LSIAFFKASNLDKSFVFSSSHSKINGNAFTISHLTFVFSNQVFLENTSKNSGFFKTDSNTLFISIFLN
jgi:hypothetical protein